MVLKVTTHLVIVDAVVTDSSGAPVRDLKKEDFGLYEDGKRQDIQVFSFEGAGRTTKLPQDRAPDGTNIYSNVQEKEPRTGPLTILLIDALNTPSEDRIFLHQQLVKYLQRSGEQVAVYSLGNRLRVLQDFTTDRESLLRVVSRMSSETSASANEHPLDGANVGQRNRSRDT
jgi:VWFA-related protein